MANWKRKPQEQEGSYFFSGQFLVTRSVMDDLPPEEVQSIYEDVKSFVKRNGGIDYLQVYTDEIGRKLFFIDQLNKEMIESGLYSAVDNVCTLLWANEY